MTSATSIPQEDWSPDWIMFLESVSFLFNLHPTPFISYRSQSRCWCRSIAAAFSASYPKNVRLGQNRDWMIFCTCCNVVLRRLSEEAISYRTTKALLGSWATLGDTAEEHGRKRIMGTHKNGGGEECKNQEEKKLLCPSACTFSMVHACLTLGNTVLQKALNGCNWAVTPCPKLLRIKFTLQLGWDKPSEK